MTYRETLAYIYGLGRFGMRPGLGKISALLKALENPQDRINSVHIAGTNGKGSTAAFLSSIMISAGYRVGLFTSPHLTRFTERIRVNGSEIGEDDVVRLAVPVMAAAPPETTFFELVTAMAWLFFAEQQVDLAVIETGMGGRFDATNAAGGLLSVITPISLDHCEHLGNSLAEIAFEKAGVIRPGRPVVSSPQQSEAMAVIGRQCEILGASLYRCGEAFGGEWEEGCLSYCGLHNNLSGLKPGIAGRHQAGNAFSALAAAELLGGSGFNVPATALATGIERTSWPGRMEIIGEAPRIMLDGAHNPAGARALAESLRDVSRDGLIVVAGVMADKDAGEIFKPLFPLADLVYAVSPAMERAMPSQKLAALCRSLGVACRDAGTVADGLEQARNEARHGDLILVCGSLFIVGEARSILCGERFEPFRG
jgi:dihydrofolate synthase / folylpolyglutamate synthase